MRCWIAWSPASLISIRCDAPINGAFTGHLSRIDLAFVLHLFSKLRASGKTCKLPALALHNVRIWHQADSRASGLSVGLPDCSNHAPVWGQILLEESDRARWRAPMRTRGLVTRLNAGVLRVIARSARTKTAPPGPSITAQGRLCRRWQRLRGRAATGCPRQRAGPRQRCRSAGSTRSALSEVSRGKPAIYRRCARQRLAQSQRSRRARRPASVCARR